MIEINLLPWRAIHRAENAKRTKIFIIYLSVLVALWIVSHVAFNLILQEYNTTIGSLQNQLAELTSQTQQNPVDPSSVIVDQIHASQIELLNFLKILRQEAQGIALLYSIASKNNHVMIRGHADSFSALTGFVNSYNIKNKSLPLTIRSTSKNNAESSLQFHLQLVRSVLSFSSQKKDDEI